LIVLSVALISLTFNFLSLCFLENVYFGVGNIDLSKGFVNTSVLLPIVFCAMIAMMVLPVPSWVLDIGLTGSFTLAILIFSISLFVEKPLDFSAFPTILLGSLVLRLSLNVSSTKLIIGQGHTGTDAAGDVIAGFANFVMGGSVFLGLVVFCVLLIVNFMVITKGATRMAEVGARFALDGMPGKQLAIDSDMSAGAIDHQQARERRETEQAETNFFGSLDGASKFVKGDAIAGLLITVLNLVAGLAMGVFVHDIGLSTAFQTYAILTVGDGLVSQIPAVIISIASAFLLARGGAKGRTDTTVFAQLSRYPSALLAVSLLLFVFALFPGLPFLPFLFVSIAMGVFAFIVGKRSRQTEQEDKILDESEPVRNQTVGDLLELDDIHIEFSPDLVEMVLDPGTGLDTRVTNMRNHIISKYGIVLPDVRLSDNASLQNGTYTISIQGVHVSEGRLFPDRVMALVPEQEVSLPDGVDTTEPVYGAPARWIAEALQESTSVSGVTVVTPAEVLATHLLEVIKQNFSRLLTLKALRRILNELRNVSDPVRADANRRLLDELIPDKVPVDVLHSVLRLLIEEQVSIRNLPLILEAIAEGRLQNARTEAICEHVRQRLGFQIVADLKREDGSVPLVQLAPDWEDSFQHFQVEVDKGLDIALPPELFNSLSEGISRAFQIVHEKGVNAALITNSKRRRFLKTVLRSRGIANQVLSFEELGLEAQPILLATVDR
jgi:flagellar biosynthesis protein FlhA